MSAQEDDDDRTAIFVFKPKRYVSTIFYLHAVEDEEGTLADWLGMVYSDDPERKAWTIRLRVRYYDPNRMGPFDNADQKNMMTGTKSNTTENEAVSDARGMFQGMASTFSAEFDEVVVQAEGTDKPMEILKRQPWVKVHPSDSTVRH